MTVDYCCVVSVGCPLEPVRFFSILDSASQELKSFPDLIQQIENTCREFSELLREEATGMHQVNRGSFDATKGSDAT